MPVDLKEFGFQLLILESNALRSSNARLRNQVRNSLDAGGVQPPILPQYVPLAAGFAKTLALMVADAGVLGVDFLSAHRFKSLGNQRIRFMAKGVDLTLENIAKTDRDGKPEALIRDLPNKLRSMEFADYARTLSLPYVADVIQAAVRRDLLPPASPPPQYLQLH